MVAQAIPSRLGPKATWEERAISINWYGKIGSRDISSVEWWSEPVGLGFKDPVTEGTVTYITVTGGKEAVEYRIQCKITAAGLPGVFGIRSGDFPGVPMLVLRNVRSGLLSAGDYAYGNL